MKGYSKLFVCHRTDNTSKCCQFVQGLLHDCKSNIECMVERIPQSNYDQLQHFISNSTETDGTEVKYSLCHSAEEKMSLSSALCRQMQRYWIERAFQNVKEQFGMSQYQVRSWRAWYHHIALSLMALHFVLEIQRQTKEEIPLISIPDIKLIFANKLQNNLKSVQVLWSAIKKRHQKRQRDLDQHSKVPK